MERRDKIHTNIWIEVKLTMKDATRGISGLCSYVNIPLL